MALHSINRDIYMLRIFFKTPLVIFFLQKVFPKFELSNLGSGLSVSAPYLPMFTVICLNKMDSKMLFSMFKKVWGLSAGTRKLGILGTLGLGFIWSCFVSSVFCFFCFT